MISLVALDGADLVDGVSVHGDLRLHELEGAGIRWVETGAAAASDADTLYVMGATRVDAELLASMPRLRHVARFGAGYDAIDVEACTAAGVVVTTTPAAVRRPLALAGLTMLLAVTHNLVQKHRIATSGEWGERRRWRGVSTEGATVGIVGFGSVGAELARMLTGLGFDVRGMNRRGRHPVAGELGIPMVGLAEALAADVVVLCAALTEQTRGMIGAEEFALMGPDSAFVNIGRGALVDQEALVSALQEGRIRAAGLDVFDPEPLPLDHPLRSLPQVTLAPHSLCWTDAFTEAVARSVNASILAVHRGEVPPAAINPEAFTAPRVPPRHPAGTR